MAGVFGGGKNEKISTSSPVIAGLQMQTSAYGRPIALVFGKTRLAGNLMWYGDFTAIPHTTTTTTGGGGSGGKGGGGGTSTQENTTYTYTAAGLMLLCRGTISTVTKVWKEKLITTLAELGLSLYVGDAAQTAFPWLTTNHPGEALAYRGLAYVASAALDLGDNAQLGNHSFEVEGLFPFSVGIRDANPKDVATALASDPVYGAGVPAGHIGNLAQFSDYCVANGIFVSPAYIEQKPAATLLANLAVIGNSEVVYSEDKIKLIPYSDAVITGNGVTYTPTAETGLSFSDNDFVYTRGQAPVEFADEDASDACNIIVVKFKDRTLDYADNTAEAKDEDDIGLNGERPYANGPIDLPEIVDAAVARLVAQQILQRKLYQRFQYTFRLGPGKADLLEPMDLIRITESRLGLVNQLVRIEQIEEQSGGKGMSGFQLTVRESPDNTNSSAVYAAQTGSGSAANYNVAPGDVNAPVILDAPAVVTDSGFELWMAVSGADPNWGGCQVWVATDPGGPFKQVGAVHGRARHGVIDTAAFPIGADPDAVNTCKVDLSVSKGALSGGTAADADKLNTIAWLEGNELISFETATLTAAYKYDLKDYLRRGVFNTEIAAHAVGKKFVRLDQALFHYPYDASLVGATLYVKLPSFNIYGAGQQDLASVAAYTYVIGGPIGAPDAPSGFTVQQIGAVLNFKVNPLEYLRLDRVEIRYADPGETNWDNGVPVTNILRGNTDSNGSTPPGAWRFMARAFDLAGNPSKTFAMYDMTVTADTFTVIRQQQEAPDWPGALVNLVKHWTGVLVPKGMNAAGTYAGNEWIDEFCPDAYPTCTYTAPEIDKAIDATARIWADIVSNLGPGEAGTSSPNHQVDYRLNAGAYDGFENWTIGTVNFRFLKSQLVMDTTVGKSRISGFRTIIDKEASTEEKHGLVVGAGGLPVVFDSKFHLMPAITPLNDSPTPLIPTHTADSIAGTTLHLFSTGAIDVGGAGGYRVNGV